MAKTAISPTREQNYPEWYQQVIKAAELAEISAVRGCMVIKPWGYAIWENLQQNLDAMIKAAGHRNIYCPLFIPLSYLEREAEHIEGFAKECAVVTHSRLSKNAEGGLDPDSPLDEPLIVRPTSETVINEMFAKWVSSYRDLPLKINQWANVVRWEMRTRMFLRTTEFLWQEGHTVHATAAEADQHALRMLDVYAEFVEDYLAIPVLRGEKSVGERFPGADATYCIEALMQDNKALQAGTSHFLGQNFSKSFDIKFTNAADESVYAYTTSWGVSTRLIGGLIMTHSDDDGLVVPPRVAPAHIILLPVFHKGRHQEILAFAHEVAQQLRNINYHGQAIRVEVDERQVTGGEKGWGAYKKGVPLRAEIGPRELAARSLFLGARNKPYKARCAVNLNDLCDSIVERLDDIQINLLATAKQRQEKYSRTINSKDEFYQFFSKANEGGLYDGGFAYAFWREDADIELQLKRDLHVTVRCYPFSHTEQRGPCIFSGDAQGRLAVFARAY